MEIAFTVVCGFELAGQSCFQVYREIVPPALNVSLGQTWNAM